eukprot:c402_g1_i1.p1 GENE.c402_g1_i1~~c402_g1_i1.p1  ORF type:complete len:343 (+),score=89.02 c402_g1_i1:44-1072(+)
MKSIFAVCLVLQVVVGIPTANLPDPEYKPEPVAPVESTTTDPYAEVHSEWHEPIAAQPNPAIPQTGSLISIAESVVPKDELIPKDPSTVQSLTPTNTIVEVPPTVDSPHPNPPENYYPIQRDRTATAYKESSEKVAAVPVVDPALKDVHGVYPEPVVFDRPEAPHPMEAKSPLADNLPCDPDHILEVKVGSAVSTLNATYATLPGRFGCSSWNDSSREKLSPEVSWSNVASDAFEFSLQMVEMGDDCSGKGPTAGRIGWHVTGIKFAPTITFAEGASHDSRLLHGGQEQQNQWLEEYYSGPCPAAGTTGCYRFKVLAHRANGWCQCGFQDVLFSRPAQPGTV